MVVYSIPKGLALIGCDNAAHAQEMKRLRGRSRGPTNWLRFIWLNWLAGSEIMLLVAVGPGRRSFSVIVHRLQS